MSDKEIRVNQTELETAISKLSSLSSGTRLGTQGPIITRSYGDTADALNELYSGLAAIEAVFLEVLEQTKKALTNAGVLFDEADQNAAQLTASVGNIIGED